MESDGQFKHSFFHYTEPDFSRPLYRPSAGVKEKIMAFLVELYGARKAQRLLPEIERVMAVYYAHKTRDMLEWEQEFTPEARFSQEDIILITYGDLIVNGSKKPLQILADLSRRYLKGVFNTIHILPFFPSSSDRGFSIRDFRQVDPALGNWEDINGLKDDFKLMFDGVFNHISSKSFWFQEFLNGNPEYMDFFTSFDAKRGVSAKKLGILFRPRTTDVLTPFHTFHGKKLVWTTFSPDQVDLNFKNPRVLLRILEILFYYVRRGADLLRLDAVTYLWDELGTTGAHLSQTHTIIRLFRTILDAVAPHVALITETNVPHAENISYFGGGDDEAQMVYNFALPPLILHTFQTGNAHKLSRWASELANPSGTATFLNFLDSHDGIGVLGARGILSDQEIQDMADCVLDCGGFVSLRKERDGSESVYELNITSFSALNREGDDSQEMQVKRYIAARSIPLVLIGVPGVYVHGLLGSKNDIEAVIQENDKRSINRDVLNEEELIAAIEDRETTTAQVSRRLTSLINKRVREKAFHPHAHQEILFLSQDLFSLVRTSLDGREKILAVTNVTDRKVTVSVDTAVFGRKIKDPVNLISGKILTVSDNTITISPGPYDVMWIKTV